MKTWKVMTGAMESGGGGECRVAGDGERFYFGSVLMVEEDVGADMVRSG